MNTHLQKARRALERQGRYVPGRGPEAGDILEAVQEMLVYLEELDQTPAVTINKPITVNKS